MMSETQYNHNMSQLQSLIRTLLSHYNPPKSWMLHLTLASLLLHEWHSQGYHLIERNDNIALQLYMETSHPPLRKIIGGSKWLFTIEKSPNVLVTNLKLDGSQKGMHLYTMQNKSLIYLILKILKKITLRICLHPKVFKMEKKVRVIS